MPPPLLATVDRECYLLPPINSIPAGLVLLASLILWFNRNNGVRLSAVSLTARACHARAPYVKYHRLTLSYARRQYYSTGKSPQ